MYFYRKIPLHDITYLEHTSLYYFIFTVQQLMPPKKTFNEIKNIYVINFSETKKNYFDKIFLYLEKTLKSKPVG